MPTLRIEMDVEVTEAEVPLLVDALGCKNSDDLKDEVQRYSAAAVREYLDMFLGTPISTATDVRERRLVGLLLTTFVGQPPGPDRVARLFNLTSTGAKNLLRSVAAKHRLRLRGELRSALLKVLNDCKQSGPGGPYSVVVVNPILVELLNDRLATSPEPKTAIKLLGDSLTKFTVDKGSYDYLRSII